MVVTDTAPHGGLVSRASMPAGPGEPRSRHERGYALLVVTAAIVVLLAAGALLTIHLQGRMALLRDQHRNLQLRGLLDSGYAYAASVLREDAFFQGDDELRLGGGVVRLEIEFATAPSFPSGLRRITLLARFQHEQRAAQGLILINPPNTPPRFFGLTPILPSSGDPIFDN